MTRARELADLLTGGQTITTADNTEQLIFKSTDADASAGPLIKMHRDSSSPADGDNLGRFNFIGENDASEEVTYARIHAKAGDVTDGTEDGQLLLLTTVDGTNRSRMAIGPSETVFNEDSIDSDFRVESNGNANMLVVDAGNDRIGIGTNSPDSMVHISAASSARLRLEDTTNSVKTDILVGDTSSVIGNASNHDLAFMTNDVNRMTIASGGNAIFNGQVMTNTIGRSDDTNTTIDFPGSDVIQFFTGGSERARLDASGRFMIGASDINSSALFAGTSASGEFAADLRNTSSSFTSIVLLLGSNTNTTNSTYDHMRCDIHGQAQKLAIRDSGNVVNANNSYGSLSDSRMKENIVDAASQWDDIKAMQVRKYNRIGETQKELGVIAQELEASGMGGLVEEGRYYDVNNNPDEETRKSVKYSVLYMKAIKALQEAMTRIETLETQNTTQATQIADLITRVTALEAE